MVICLYLSIMASIVFLAADGVIKWVAYAAHIIFFTIACYSWHKMKDKVTRTEFLIDAISEIIKKSINKERRSEEAEEENGGEVSD